MVYGRIPYLNNDWSSYSTAVWLGASPSVPLTPTACRMNMSRDQGNWCSGVELSSFVITKSWWLKDHSRWVFRKNSIEFSIGFDYLLILLYKWLCSTITQSYVFPEYSMITWPYHVIWLPNSHTIYILFLLYNLMLEIKCSNVQETLSFLGLS